MTVGVTLAMLSLGVLIFFIHHVATSIQASRIIANVADDLEAATPVPSCEEEPCC